MNNPKPNSFDLEKLWERHVELEFAVGDADATVETMTEDPYVNHVPTMTGGRGRALLRDFYRDKFIARLPSDTKTVPVSRTVGPNRLVDEMIFCFTHDKEIDFMLPGVPPTGKYVEVALVAIVTFDGGKIACEHIYWDQASVLVQLGLLDPKGLPVCGVESARKVADKNVEFRAIGK